MLRLYGGVKFHHTRKISTFVLSQFEEILGIEDVSVAKAIRDHHSHDESYFPWGKPSVVLMPKSTKEVSKCVKVCNKEKLPMIPFGTGTGLEGGVTAVKECSVCFNLMKMEVIREFHADDADVTVEPGVTRGALNNYLRQTGLWFPVDPGADASLCGMAAVSASGTNAVRYGTMRERVLNMEVVLPSGSIIYTSGVGSRPRKTSAGYSLTDLFIGSEGTLGIITSATLRLAGYPARMVSAVCQFASVKDAVDATVVTLQSGVPIARVELLDEVQVRACNIFSRLHLRELPTLFFEFHGSESSVEEQTVTVGEIVKDHNGSDFEWAKDEEERNRLWTARHNAWYAALNLRPGSKAIATDVCVPISRLAEMVVETKKDIQQSSLIGPIVGHVGDGNFHSLLLVDLNNAQELRAAQQVAHRMARRAQSMNGTCTGEHGIGLGKKHLLELEYGPVAHELMKSIKRVIDPHCLMNPGKVLDL